MRNLVPQERIDKGIYWGRAWSLINGCTKVSEGCLNCWSLRDSNRFNPTIDNWSGNIVLRKDNLNIPSKIKKPTVFAIWNDLFHEAVPFDFIDNIWWQQRHIYLILTKRPQRMYEYFTHKSGHLDLINNIWLGTTAENQKMADDRIKHLLSIPVQNRFISFEPLLENVIFDSLLFKNKIRWVILGAESGANKRECKIEWIEKIVNDCKLANVKVFVKQIHVNGKLVKDMNIFPENIRLREFPL